jgi:cytochrome c peroxidase
MKKLANRFFIWFFLLGIFSFCFLNIEIFHVPKNWPKPNYDFKKNPIIKEKVLLGRVLFYDPILSRDSSISCSSCHSQYNGFAHADHALSHGINDQIGTRNAPSLVNLAWQKNFMWDGAIHHLDAQAISPISNPMEMNEQLGNVVKKLNRSKLYKGLYYSAYNDSNVTGEKTLKAISQFLLTLVSSNSKYDLVMRKEEKFTDQEKNGYEIFKKNCSSCHKEPLFTNNEFENNGLLPDKKLFDVGRNKITLNPNDSFKFKVPTLRNLEFTYPYMHDGRFRNLNEVINHYVEKKFKHKIVSLKLPQNFNPSSKEKTDLVAFLLTLTDKSFIYNEKFGFPKSVFQKK